MHHRMSTPDSSPYVDEITLLLIDGAHHTYQTTLPAINTLPPQSPPVACQDTTTQRLRIQPSATLSRPWLALSGFFRQALLLGSAALALISSVRSHSMNTVLSRLPVFFTRIARLCHERWSFSHGYDNPVDFTTTASGRHSRTDLLGFLFLLHLRGAGGRQRGFLWWTLSAWSSSERGEIVSFPAVLQWGPHLHGGRITYPLCWP